MRDVEAAPHEPWLAAVSPFGQCHDALLALLDDDCVLVMHVVVVVVRDVQRIWLRRSVNIGRARRDGDARPVVKAVGSAVCLRGHLHNSGAHVDLAVEEGVVAERRAHRIQQREVESLHGAESLAGRHVVIVCAVGVDLAAVAQHAEALLVAEGPRLVDAASCEHARPARHTLRRVRIVPQELGSFRGDAPQIGHVYERVLRGRGIHLQRRRESERERARERERNYGRFCHPCCRT